MSYEVDEINDFDEAQSVATHKLLAEYIVTFLLRIEGYSPSQIGDFLTNNQFDYELNGIEIKELGQAKEFSNGDKAFTVSPISFKIDLDKANLNVRKGNNILYTVLSGDNQEYDIKSELGLMFKFSIDYDLFKSTGKLFIDGREVPSDKYEVTKGSTIVTISNDYISEFENGNHTISAMVGNDKVDAKFTILNGKTQENNIEENPKTIDNILFYVWILLFSILGFGSLLKKRII